MSNRYLQVDIVERGFSIDAESVTVEFSSPTVKGTIQIPTATIIALLGTNTQPRRTADRPLRFRLTLEHDDEAVIEGRLATELPVIEGHLATGVTVIEGSPT